MDNKIILNVCKHTRVNDAVELTVLEMDTLPNFVENVAVLCAKVFIETVHDDTGLKLMISKHFLDCYYKAITGEYDDMQRREEDIPEDLEDEEIGGMEQ